MKLKENLPLKILAAVMAMVLFAAGAGLCTMQIANYSVIWEDSDTFYGCATQQMLRQAERDIAELLSLSDSDSVYARRRAEELNETLDAGNTNLRWQLRLEDRVISGNAEGSLPPDAEYLSYRVNPDDPQIHSWDTANDSLPGAQRGELLLWLEEGLPVKDGYREADTVLKQWRANRIQAVAVMTGCFLAGVLLTVFLCVACGHKKGREGIYLCWFHRIPGDLLLAAYILGFILLCAGVAESFGYYSYRSFETRMTLSVLCAAGMAALVISWAVTFTARCKGRSLLRDTVIGWICVRLWRGCRAAAEALPLIWKAALSGAAYLILSLILAPGVVWIVLSAAVLVYLCWWAYRWKQVRQGAREIISGNLSYRINSEKMPPDLRKHAEELNNLGQAIGAAVEERMRSEHFKAELITNVSHDLKTPLTSIISYVDLLRKESIENPRAREYIDVLDRKCQRLKKLTEDLVEASKASTGALKVERERIDLVQLTEQALGEYEERLRSSGLTVVRTLPAQPVWVIADGRHLWRIMDNLLSNCGKYALEGTRVYVEVQDFADCAKLRVKNISREELNIPAQQLTERFVRGDESRTMEGSGLGLSIAQSLTELQQGGFEVDVDGDLFKATVTLPLAAGT